MSLKYHELPDDTCRLVATWIIPYLDIHGVFYADPLIVKGMVVPMRMDITPDAIERYLSAMASVGLIKLYWHGGHLWQYWPGFIENQAGLRPGKEAKPEYPEFVQEDEIAPVDRVQNDSGVSTALVRSESVPVTPEKKRKEEKGRTATPRAPDPTMSNQAVIMYRETFNMTPTPENRVLIADKVTDFTKWGEILQLWKTNQWNCKNISFIVDRYQTGGRGKNGHAEVDQTMHAPGDIVLLPDGTYKNMAVK